MPPERTPMPPRDEVHPDFDGHLQRPFSELSTEERLDWIWETMQLLRLGRIARGEDPDRNGGDPV